MKPIAVIPAKGTSKRLPGKNMKLFNGVPLVVHCIQRLKESEAFSAIIVGSDDGEILSESVHAGAEVIRRDAYFCDETKVDANMMIGDLMVPIYDIYDSIDAALIHCTNPLVMPSTYAAAVRSYLHRSEYDSVVSVSKHLGHYWDKNGRWLTYDPLRQHHTLASECRPIFKQDGAIFIRPVCDWLQKPRFVGDKPYLFVTPPEEVADIDTQDDWDDAERRWQHATRND